jgi:putative endopeptidase
MVASTIRRVLLAVMATTTALLASGCSATTGQGAATPLPSADASGQTLTSNVRPQDDLYQAINGRWLTTTPMPSGVAHLDALHHVGSRVSARLFALVDALAQQPQAPGSAAQRVAVFHAAFVNTDAIDRVGLAPLTALFAPIDAIDSLSALAAWQGRMVGVFSMPVDITVRPDAKTPTVQRLTLSQGGLGLPQRAYDTSRNPLGTQRDAYQKYLGLLAMHAGLPQPDDVARRVWATEQRIAKAHSVGVREIAKLYNPMLLTALIQAAPGFDWTAYLDAARLVATDRLVAYFPTSATAMAQLMADIALPDWKLYFKLRLVDSLSRVLPKPIRDARAAFDRATPAGDGSPLPRAYQSLEALNAGMGDALGSLYVAKHFPAAHKTRVQAMAKHLLDAYQASLQEQTWMTDATKTQALRKLSKMRVKVGHPDRWRDDSKLDLRSDDALGNAVRVARHGWEHRAAQAGRAVDHDAWTITPQTANAFYTTAANEVVIPAALLEPPFFDPNADDAVLYGALGQVIGHEISHAFDTRGSQFDADGALQHWWGDGDRKAYGAMADQLVAQYAQYEPLPGQRVNGRLTLNENMADLSGLQIAYKAYVLSLQGKRSSVVQGATGEQRFFYSYALVFRSKLRDSAMLELLQTGPHAPSEFRVNGVVMHLDGFHEAFGTKPSDKLYKPVGERLRLW